MSNHLESLTGVLVHPSLSNAWEISFPIQDTGFSSSSHNYSGGTEYIADEFVLLRLLLAVVFISMAAWAYGRLSSNHQHWSATGMHLPFSV